MKQILQTIARRAIKQPDPDETGVFADFSPQELSQLDCQYRRMFEINREAHAAAIAEIAGAGCRSVAEVACGSGFNCPAFTARGISYTGIDISETAIATACLKHTAGDFINLPVDRLDILRDRCFDAVYSSSMLEHIGFPQSALAAMWRLAGKLLCVLFYEGLVSNSDDDVIRFFPYEPNETARESGGYYGAKVARQDHGAAANGPGYFMNRFSESSIRKIAARLDGSASVEIRHFALDRERFRSIAIIGRCV